ncbi:MAG: hypothetical protein RLZZ273_545 [Bacteroidota bacterium]|jgi:hypothetical protein
MRHLHLRHLVTCFAVVVAMSMQVFGQESEYSDPYTIDDPKEWHEALVPAPFGVIGYGNLALTGKPEEGSSYQNSTRAGLMVYYDAWQAAFEMRPEATYVRLMPRSVGRDGHVAAVLEYGWASTSAEVDSYYGGTTTPLMVSETRTGVGLSVRTGSSENVGARFIFDATIGLLDREFKSNDLTTNESNSIYYTLQIGVLARVPLGSLVVNAGPCFEFGKGMQTYSGVPGAILTDETYARLGLQFEVALNLNRPSYLTGAQ